MLKRNTQIMLGVFALLLIVFLVLQNTGDGDTGVPADLPTQPVVSPIFDFDVSLVTGIRIENLDSQAVDFTREGEVWLLNQPPAPAELTDITRIESMIASFVSLRRVTETSLEASLAVLGLQYPPYVLTITLSDGTQHELAIGDPAVTGTGYYVSLDGAQPVLATKSVLDQFIGLLAAPPLLPTTIPLPTEPLTDTLPSSGSDPTLEPGETAQP